jgi:putative membrane-bound dehydrogenase-like protein
MKAVSLTCLALLFCSSLRADSPAPKDVFNYEAQKSAPEGTKRVVFIAATGSHGARGNHEFLAGATYLARQLNANFPKAYAVVYPQDKWPADLTKADAIIVLMNHAGKAADDANIKAAVERGAGFGAIHYGVEVNKGAQGDNFLNWMGGYFETFWSVNPTWKAEVNLIGKHPVGNGVKPFAIDDEWYYHMRFAEGMKGVTPILSAIAPVATVHFKDGDKPNAHGGNADALKAVQAGEPQHLAWAYERPKGGRGFGFTGFHNFTNLMNDGFRTTMLNGVAWIAGLEIPENGVASKTPTQQELTALMDEAHGPAKNAAAPAKVAVDPATAPKPVYEGPVLASTSNRRMVPVKVDLKGAKELYLVVSDEGDKSCDWADWIAPKLILEDGTEQKLTELKWKSASAGSGGARVGKSAMGGALMVEKENYEDAIGTHATSVIAYDLPKGAVRFEAKSAIDDGGMVRGGQPSNAKLRFYVYTEKPSLLPAKSSESQPKYDPNAPKLVPAEMFAAPEGLEVTVWATSPLLYNPTNIDFDAQGRLYVAEGVNYRGKAGRRKEGDRIVVLEDTKGEGKADKSTVFVQDPNLAAPLGVAVLDDKVIVSQPPDLLVYTDTNHNGVFDEATDKREVLLTGFGGRQHDHSLHSLTAGPDGQWYFNQGNTGAEFTDKSGKTFRMGSPYQKSEIAGQESDDGHVWIGGFTARMNPDGTNVTIIGHNYRNSFEQTVNSFGDLYQSDNDDPPACRVTNIMEGGNAGFASVDGKRSWAADKRPGQDTPTAEWRQEDPGTMPAGDVYGGGSPTGVAFYENGALGERWRGLLLACEAGKNVVFGYFPKPDGAGFKLERFDFLTSNREKEFAGSDFLGGKANDSLKTKFRPSDVCVGPDGAIYVADWFDARVGGHGTLDDGYTGTIYRIAPKGFKSVVPKFDLATTDGQIAALKSPAVNVRNSGFTRLKAQGDKAVPAVAALLKDENPYIAARAIWLLAQMGDAGVAKVKPLLESADAAKRLVAYRALRRANHDELAMAAKMASDESAAVRREVALTLRDAPSEKSIPVLVKLAKQFDGKDRAYLEAMGLGSSGKEKEVYEAVARVMGGKAEEWSEAFAWIAWRLHPAEAVNDFKARVLSDKLNETQRKLMLTALGFVKSREAAGAMIEIANTKDFAMKDLAKWWLFNRKGNDWMHYDVEGGMKALGLYDPEKIQLVAVEMPAEIKDAPKLPPVAEILKLEADAKRGQTAVAVCYTCHKIGKTGVEFGPELTTFGKQQPAEVVANAIANPSAEISHGFEGSEVKTKDGLTITGMILSNGDPLIMKCMGGIVQTVPRDRVASVKKMQTSLMYQPAQLGLTAQSIADIVAYLKSGEVK